MEPIAIVGIGCRFPSANGPQAFWELLRNGVDAISETPSGRWSASFYDEDPAAPGKMNTRWGGFLAQIDRFDAAFFKISPVEAVQMDPQQRLLLEVVWESLEDAGIVPSRLAGAPVGVFIGVMSNDYGEISRFAPALVDAYTCPGNGYCIAANRISYVFDFRGPSVAVDTACSSSLVAVDLACASLGRGECDLAIAGGVNALLSPWGSIYFTKASLMSPTGHCKPFDASADGIVRGEGAGVVVLRRLADAIADGNAIYAVIHGTAVNQDGRSNGLTAPNRWSQEAVLRAAYERAGISPGMVQYVEAHGTGTPLGDPLEAKALGAVLADGRSPEQPCLIGSVKSNMGHLESAAGIAGLIKVALALKHRAIPPSLHFHTPNPNIPFADLPLRVAQTLTPWPATGPALAGVSSFGFGGTNAHVVVAEAPPLPAVNALDPQKASRLKYHLLPLAARTPAALRELAHAYCSFLTGAGAALPLADICCAATLGREHHAYRLGVVGNEHAGIVAALQAFLQDTPSPAYAVGQARPRRRLKPVFIGCLLGSGLSDVCLTGPEDERIGRPAGWALLQQLAEQSATDPAARAALSASLAAWWRAWGVEPLAILDADAPDLPEQLRTLRGRGHNIFVPLTADAPAAVALAAAFPSEDAERLILTTRGESAGILQTTLHALAALYAFGFSPTWERVYPGPNLAGRLLAGRLPTYPWQQERFWLEPASSLTANRSSNPHLSANPLLGTPVALAHLPGQIIWELRLDAPDLAYLANHQLQGEAVLPGAAFLEMVVAALFDHFGAGTAHISDLTFHKPLYQRAASRLQMVWRLWDERAGGDFQIYSRVEKGGNDWILHASGQMHLPEESALTANHTNFYESSATYSARHLADSRISGQPGETFFSSMNGLATRPTAEVAGPDFYAQQAARGNQWGLHFQSVQRLWLGAREGIAELRPPDEVAAALARYQFHPALLDACGHVLAALMSAAPGDQGNPFVLSHIEHIEMYGRRPTPHLWSRGQLSTQSSASGAPYLRRGDVYVYDEAGDLLAAMRGVHFRYLDPLPNRRQEVDFYRVAWQPAPLAASVPAAAQNWLIFADNQQMGMTLQAALADAGHRCTLVWPGETYQITAPGCCEIDPFNAAHYHSLFAAARYTGAIYLWALEMPALPPTTQDELQSAQLSNSPKLTHLFRSSTSLKQLNFLMELICRWLLRINLSAVQLLHVAEQLSPGIPVFFVTRGVHRLAGQPLADTPVAMAQATLWGVGRAAMREYAGLRCKLVDLAAADGLAATQSLLAELQADDAEAQIAWRGQTRYAAHIVPFELSLPTITTPIRADGSYLITGGLGGLGLQTGQWLAEQKAGRLILLSRTGLPPREQWREAEILAQFGAQIKAIQRMEQEGAAVVVVAADVSDADGLHAALEPYQKQETLPLRGVIHAAGVAARLPLSELTPDTLWEMLRAKVWGGWLLHELLLAEPLDFFVCYSSAAALFPSPLLGAYSAANAFLDALAHYRAQANLPALSINWGPWAESGMAARRDTFATDLMPLSPTQALAALDQLLRQPEITQAAVMRVATQTQERPFLDQPVGYTAAHALTRAQVRDVSAADGYRLLETHLRQQLADVLKLSSEKIDAQEALNNLGIDSLMALALKRKMEAGLEVSIPIATFYEGVTLAQLTRDILDQITSEQPPQSALAHRTGERVETPYALRDEEAARLLSQLAALSDAEVEEWLGLLLPAEGEK
ncbi:MAG: hypothetical protein Fur0021_16560 [Candidatus Promineifilaceae bacterium]